MLQALSRAMAASKLKQLPAMVAGVMGNDSTVQTECTTQFRRLLSIEKNPPIQQVIEAGVVPRFVEFLQRDDDPALHFEAAWALTNIASGTSDHTKVVMEAGAVPIFLRLLRSPNDDVREQAVWALGNIAGDSPPCRDLALRRKEACWTISNITAGNKEQIQVVVENNIIPPLIQLLTNAEFDIRKEAAWAIFP
jgi:importin subunit alpha-1